MIEVRTSGSFSNTQRFFDRLLRRSQFDNLHIQGRKGVVALRNATPVDSGRTAEAWDYQIVRKGSVYILQWTNSNIEDGIPIAILIQYGHGTGTGGYVSGYDYINPAIRPVFDEIAEDIWRTVRHG